MAGIRDLPVKAKQVAKAGRRGDTMLAHINPREAAMLKAAGGSGSVNPKTGLPEFFFEGNEGYFGGGGGSSGGAGELGGWNGYDYGPNYTGGVEQVNTGGSVAYYENGQLVGYNASPAEEAAGFGDFGYGTGGMSGVSYGGYGGIEAPSGLASLPSPISGAMSQEAMYGGRTSPSSMSIGVPQTSAPTFTNPSLNPGITLGPQPAGSLLGMPEMDYSALTPGALPEEAYSSPFDYTTASLTTSPDERGSQRGVVNDVPSYDLAEGRTAGVTAGQGAYNAGPFDPAQAYSEPPANWNDYQQSFDPPQYDQNFSYNEADNYQDAPDFGSGTVDWNAPAFGPEQDYPEEQYGPTGDTFNSYPEEQYGPTGDFYTAPSTDSGTWSGEQSFNPGGYEYAQDSAQYSPDFNIDPGPRYDIAQGIPSLAQMPGMLDPYSYAGMPQPGMNIGSVQSSVPAFAQPQGQYKNGLEKLGAYVGRLEAPKGPNSLNYTMKGVQPPDFSKMTWAQVLDWQSRQRTPSTAIGQFQMNRDFIARGIKEGRINPNELMTPKSQQRVFEETVRPQWDAYQAGRISKEQFGNYMNGVWAALPDPSGRSKHEGILGNRALDTWDNYMAAIMDANNSHGFSIDMNSLPTGLQANAVHGVQMAMPDEALVGGYSQPSMMGGVSQSRPAAEVQRNMSMPSLPEEQAPEFASTDWQGTAPKAGFFDTMLSPYGLTTGAARIGMGALIPGAGLADTALDAFTGKSVAGGLAGLMGIEKPEGKRPDVNYDWVTPENLPEMAKVDLGISPGAYGAVQPGSMGSMNPSAVPGYQGYTQSIYGSMVPSTQDNLYGGTHSSVPNSSGIYSDPRTWSGSANSGSPAARAYESGAREGTDWYRPPGTGGSTSTPPPNDPDTPDNQPPPGAPENWDDQAYLDANPEVEAAVEDGVYTSGFEFEQAFKSVTGKSYAQAKAENDVQALALAPRLLTTRAGQTFDAPQQDIPEPYKSMGIQSLYGMGPAWNYFPNKSGYRLDTRAKGGLLSGPGTETSDSIPAVIDGTKPAALSDGEFVFTGQAVRGAGNGDRMEGAKNLYKLMANLEQRAPKKP